MDYYEILGVARDATQPEIKRAYRSKASQLHPDREGGDTKLFQDLQRAYECLKDPERRARYDAGEEDLTKVDLQAHVNRIVRELFSMAVERNVRPGKVMDTVRYELADRVSSLAMQKAGLLKKIKEFKDRMANITLDSEGGDNLYQAVLTAKISELEHSIASYSEAQEMLNRASGDLDKYTEIKVPDPIPPTTFGNARVNPNPLGSSWNPPKGFNKF
jgi:hypothetical protein